MRILRFLGKCLRFINENFKAIVLVLVVLLVVGSMRDTPTQQPNLAKLYLTTPIFSATSIESQIQNIKKNSSIQGVLLVIDSPGGSVSASIEVADLIKELGQDMPVVAYVQGSMASGSYYGGMYASEIVANRGALIGSIGVIFSGYNIAHLLENLGIQEQVLKKGEYKEVGTMSRQWSAQEREFLDNLLSEQYAMFVNDVKTARGDKLSQDSQAFAQGKIFSAKTALQLGLIDKIGSLQEATEILKTKAHVDEVVWLKKSKIDSYVEQFQDSLISKVLSLGAPSLR
ncbi:signal peptide peptidase SppA [Helicobacter equorum]|uniref:signal peptide peptidase SppA n=1 Tax=Helicobacter equorum TaxID=361872 RepID=UPI0018F81741|nr:signal peptide peptidase SppA [Helicobacter equorum]